MKEHPRDAARAASALGDLFSSAAAAVLKGDNVPSGPSSDDIARANDIARSEVLRVFGEVSGVSVAAGPSDLDILLTVDEHASVRPESVVSLRFTIAAGDGEGSRDIVEGAGVNPDEP